MAVGHIIPRKTYYSVFAVLMLLMAATVGVAFVHLGDWNVVAAMTIAVTKAVLIVLYFMHLRNSSHVTWIFVSAGVFWLGIMMVLSMSDYLTRSWLPDPTGWLN